MISEACATPNSAEGNRRPIRTSESTAHRAPANFTSTRAAFEPVIPSQQVQRLASVHSTKRTTICLNATERLRQGRESRWAASDPLLHSCANHYCVRALEACACDSISEPRAPEHWTVGATQPVQWARIPPSPQKQARRDSNLRDHPASRKSARFVPRSRCALTRLPARAAPVGMFRDVELDARCAEISEESVTPMKARAPWAESGIWVTRRGV